MALGKISFQIDVDTKQLSSDLKKASSSFKDVADTAQAVGDKVSRSTGPLKGMTSSVGGFISKVGQFAVAGVAVKAASAAFGMLSANVQEALSASDSLDKFQQTMQFAGIDKGAIADASKAVKKYADDTVYDLSTVANTTAQLASNGVKDFTGLTQAAGNLNAVAGGNADTFKSVAMVLTQTAGAGKLTTENWNQLSDAIPGAAGPLQEALKKAGAFTGNFRDAMAEGQITADEFNAALMDLGMSDVAKEAATSTSTFEGAFGSLEATVVNGLQSMIDSIGKGNLVGLINGFTSAVQTGFSYVSQAIQAVMPYVSSFFSSFAGLVGQALTAFSGFLPSISSIFQSIIDVALPILSAVIDGVKQYIGFLVEYWTGIFSGDNSVWNSFTRIFQSILEVAVPILQDAISFIQSIVGQLTTFWQENGQQIIAAVQNVFSMVASIIDFIMPAVEFVIKSVWNNIKELTQGVLNAILGAVKIFASLFTGDWKGLWQGVKKLLSGALQALWNLWNLIAMGKILNSIKTFVSAGFSSIKGFASNIVNAFKGMLTGAKGSWNALKSAISGAINGAKSIATGAANGIKSAVSGAFNGLKSMVTGIWNGIKTAITTPIQAAKNTVAGIVSKIKSLFNFKLSFPSISIPHIPLPHFSISGSFNPLKGELPHIGINWYATGGIFNGPSVVGIGEAGTEAVVPLSNKSKMAPFAKAVADFMKDEQSTGYNSSRAERPIILHDTITIDGKAIVTTTRHMMYNELKRIDAMESRRLGKR